MQSQNVRHKIMQYLNCSAGTANIPTDHTIDCFIGMIETGEATEQMFREVGGQYIIDRINSRRNWHNAK